MQSDLSIVILAAGKGTRMRSAKPKVLHTLAGKPMLQWVVDTARSLKPARIAVVVGHGAAQLPPVIAGVDQWITQSEQKGTGHAVQCALAELPCEGRVLILYGDVPLLSTQTLHRLLECAQSGSGMAVLAANFADPTGYGRIVQDAQGQVAGIVEERDASAAQRQIKSINTGVLVAEAQALKSYCGHLSNDNAQGEYYLTDVFAFAAKDMRAATMSSTADVAEVQGVNDRLQLAQLERVYQQRQSAQLMREGVAFDDPQRVNIRGQLHCGQDVRIGANVEIEGEVYLADNVTIEAFVVLRDVRVAAGARICSFSHLVQCEVGEAAQVGPYARLREGTSLGAHTRVGNFVETKAATFAAGSKANHLSYIGNATLGERVNIGAGTITCNYDGANKHHTVIEDDVFIGSDTQLVAPVTVGQGATVGAGSTVTRDVQAGSLLVNKRQYVRRDDWRRPQKDKA